MTFQDLVPYLISAISILFTFLATKLFPLFKERIQRQDKQEQDEQEHRQRKDELSISYHLSVGAEAHRMMGDLLSTSQENERVANTFIRQDVKNDLEAIAEKLGNLAIAVSKLIETEENRAKLFTLQNGILSEMSHNLRSQQAKITAMIELLKNENN